MAPGGILASYDFSDKTVVVTGGGGVLCAELARGLADCHAGVVLVDRDLAAAERALATLPGAGHRALQADLLDRAGLAAAADAVAQEYGRIDGLINGAGGNHPTASTDEERSFFDLPADALQFVANLNLVGTILPSQAFGRHMARQGEGAILNISSMNAYRPLTRIPAYSAAKAAVSNFTQWLAVHLAQEYSPNIRVNALAPGFFLTEQNRFLLTEKGTGELTARGKSILAHTPMARFGSPVDLVGTMLWLLSPAASFVTGIVVPVDGGFSAYSGV
jgi:NAD(P)-dependent dehydrogenase (short-subunit alcohol dehydrogenase family)